jgi:hypothetical protein
MSRRHQVAVAEPERGLVRIHLVKVDPMYGRREEEMWFSKQNLRWVVDSLERCLSMYGFPGAEAVRGDDSFDVYAGGTEHEPAYSLLNQRAGSHDGVYALSMKEAGAKELLTKLRALLGAGSVGIR